jgi:hypothetical protein
VELLPDTKVVEVTTDLLTCDWVDEGFTVAPLLVHIRVVHSCHALSNVRDGTLVIEQPAGFPSEQPPDPNGWGCERGATGIPKTLLRMMGILDTITGRDLILLQYE